MSVYGMNYRKQEERVRRNIAHNFRVLMSRKKATLAVLEAQTGIRLDVMTEYLSAQKMPSLVNLIRICEALNCSIDMIVRGKDHE